LLPGNSHFEKFEGLKEAFLVEVFNSVQPLDFMAEVFLMPSHEELEVFEVIEVGFA